MLKGKLKAFFDIFGCPSVTGEQVFFWPATSKWVNAKPLINLKGQ